MYNSMPRKNSKQRAVLPLLVGGMLLAQRGYVVVGQEMIENDPLESQQNLFESQHNINPSEKDEARINDALEDVPPPVHGETTSESRDTSHESSVHTDYIHQIERESIENNTNIRGSYSPQHAGDVSSEQRDCAEEAKSKEEAVPTFTIEQLRTLLQTLEEGEKVDTVHRHRSWKSSDLVDNDKPNESLPKVMVEDDRTLLDIFGEAAKQFLTQKVVRIDTATNFRCPHSTHGTFLFTTTKDSRNKSGMQMGLAIIEL